MTTAAERLRSLSGLAGASAAVMLLAIGQGATAAQALSDYSGLPSGSAATHLLTDVAVQSPTIPAAIYGSGRELSRDDVEKHWELLALRDQEEARLAKQSSELIPVVALVPSSQSVPAAEFIVAHPAELSAQVIAKDAGQYLQEQQRIETLARIKRQNEEALILILMEM